MRPQLVRPEIRKGPVHDYGPVPRITPEHLMPGVSLLVVTGEGYELPPGTLCLFLAHRGGRAIVGVEGQFGALECLPIAAHDLDVYVPPIAELSFATEFHDYREGFATGAWESLNERPISQNVHYNEKRVPTWFGWGVIDGYKARLNDRGGWEADDWYRERLRTSHPLEWPQVMPWEPARVA